MSAGRSKHSPVHGNPFLREKVHDPYRETKKPQDSTRCPDCGVIFHKGRWQMPEKPATGPDTQRCPACRRIADRYPAGELLLSGSFVAANHDAILATIKRIEQSERDEHPLHRIMSLDENDDGIAITTTDVHLPHRIAHAIQSAFGGEMKTHYDLEGYFTRVQLESGD